MQQTLSQKPTRREFLNYVWGASMALALAQMGGIAFWFALPRLRGASKLVSVAPFVLPDSTPQSFRSDNAGFFVAHSERGIAAFDHRCTHSHCLFPWSEAAGIFACPCHGSQFEKNGDYIAGPAPRALDRYAFEVWGERGEVLAASPRGEPVPLPPGAISLHVRTDRVFEGKWHVDRGFGPTAMPEPPKNEH